MALMSGMAPNSLILRKIMSYNVVIKNDKTCHPRHSWFWFFLGFRASTIKCMMEKLSEMVMEMVVVAMDSLGD